MPTFALKTRTTGAIVESTLDAATREEAVAAAAAAAGEGEAIEVLNCVEVPGSGDGGATGATGAAA